MSVRVAFAGSGDAFTHIGDDMLARTEDLELEAATDGAVIDI